MTRRSQKSRSSSPPVRLSNGISASQSNGPSHVRAGGKVDQPLIITDTKGIKHTVANPGDKIVKNFTMDNFSEGRNLLPERVAGVLPATGRA